MNSPHIVRKTTSPTSAPPEAGIHWINTVTHEEFFSVGTNSVNEWIKRSVTRTADALETTVWNQTGVTIPKFSVVYINGSQGTYPTVALAQANSEMTSTGTYGVTANAIPNNQQGTVIPFGLLENINTNGFTNGQAVFLSPTVAGAVTSTKPSAPNHIVYIGTITRAHPSLGRIEVKVVNGYELEELHNVAISAPTTGQTLTYNSSTQLWNNYTLTKSDVGLSNADNTSDANKPISTATQTALNLKQATITGAATSIVSSDLTASKILASNGSGKVSASSIDSANLNYLDATSSIQTQINSKANDADVLKKDGSVSLTGDLNLGTHKITNVVDPLSNQDAATKFYVDNLVSGLDWKQACHVASVANVNIASAPASIDGHAFVNTERVLLKDQSTASQNGIYVFNGTGNALTRATDADTWNEIVGSVVYIEQGSTNGGSKWNCTNVSGGTLGVTAINFTLFSSASSLSGVGTTNYNAYWTGANVLSAEQYVSTSRGGLGTDGSSFTGVVKSSSGSFSASSIDNADISVIAAIDATKIGSGSVSNTEFGYLDGVSSSIQTQLNNKADAYFISPEFGSEIWRGYTFQNNSTTVTVDNIAAQSTNGSPTARTVATTNALTKTVRLGIAVSTPAANGVCGMRSSSGLFTVGTGFRFTTTFAYTDSQFNTGALQFYGMTASTGGITISSTASVSSLLNMIGIGNDAGDTALSIFHNAGGTSTKITLSATDFPCNRAAGAASTDIFKIELYNAIASSNVLYRVTNLTTGVIAQGTLSSNLPSSTTLLTFQAIRTSGSSSNACSMDLTKLGVWSLA
jgi:hypothetical protein